MFGQGLKCLVVPTPIEPNVTATRCPFPYREKQFSRLLVEPWQKSKVGFHSLISLTPVPALCVLVETLRMLAVNEIMTADVVTIRPDAPISDAIELLLARRVSGLPVVDSSGRLVGILTEFALLALAYDSNVADHTVADHMTHDVLTVDATDLVSKVADFCIVHRVRRLPVLSDGRLVGLVSRRDVLESLYQSTAPVTAC